MSNTPSRLTVEDADGLSRADADGDGDSPALVVGLSEAEASPDCDADTVELADADAPGGAKANLRNLVALALDAAVRELIRPVVDRSVTIAVITVYVEFFLD